MDFLSISWFAWMLLTIAFYWLFPSRWRNSFLSLISIIFLFSVDSISAALLCVLTIFTYTVGQVTTKRILLAAAGVIAILIYFKSQVTSNPFNVIRDVAMPIGLSYYAFRIIHYLIEKARNTLPEHGFIDYVNYLFFLPTLLVGPIHRFPQYFHNNKNIEWRSAQISVGLERILFGYFKITVLGNFLMSKYFAIAIGSLDESVKPLALYLEAVRGSFNLYFQFSGYSDIAIGFALMLGYQVMENFNFPFFKKNIAEFWRSWHISLTSWSRDYIYMTVVGMTRNPYYGTLSSLMLIGIWHELSFRYVAWGLYHGFGIIFVGQFQKFLRKKKLKPIKNKLLKFLIDGLKIMATCNFFFLGYVIIHQNSIEETLKVYWVILFSWWI